MAHEHCAEADARVRYTSPSYGVTTTSEIEWHFVANPDDGLGLLKLDAWPVEALLVDHSDPVMRARMRRPHHTGDLDARVRERSILLAGLGVESLIDAEVLAAKLYTGPSFCKYNAVLRALTEVQAMVLKRDELCLGNR